MKKTFLFAVAFTLFSGRAYASLDDDLLVYFSFNEEFVGDIVPDESSSGNDGSVVGTLTYEPDGHFGGAYSFTRGNHIILGGNPTANLEELTVSVWVKSDPENDYKIASAAAHPPGSGWVLGIRGPEIWRPNGHIIWGEPEYCTVSLGERPQVGKWSHMVISYNGTSFQAYLNGKLITDCSTSGEKIGDARGQKLAVGAWPQYSGFGYNGLMDEFRVYNRGVSAEEVNALYLYNGVCESFGIEDSWLERCPKGYDVSPSQAKIKLEFPIGQIQNLSLSGPTKIFRDNLKITHLLDPELADDEMSQYAIQTEIVKFELTGKIPGLGEITVYAGDEVGNLKEDDPFLYSPGIIYDTPGNVCSIFVVRFKIKINGIDSGLHGKSRMKTCAIDQLPPISTPDKPIIYIDPRNVPIFDSKGKKVGEIRNHEHKLIEQSLSDDLCAVLPEFNFIGVDDQGLNNSRFFTMNLTVPPNDPQFLVTFGPLYQGYDIEALDSSDPKKNPPNDDGSLWSCLYLASGDKDGGNSECNTGCLYYLNKRNANLTLVGDICTKDKDLLEVDALAFRFNPDLGWEEIWGWSQPDGLFKIKKFPVVEDGSNLCGDNREAVEAEMVCEMPNLAVEDMTWVEKEDVFYVANAKTIYTLKPQTCNYKKVCENKHEIEALEYISIDETLDLLIMGFHKAGHPIAATKLNGNCDLFPSTFPTGADVEGLAYP